MNLVFENWLSGAKLRQVAHQLDGGAADIVVLLGEHAARESVSVYCVSELLGNFTSCSTKSDWNYIVYTVLYEI